VTQDDTDDPLTGQLTRIVGASHVLTDPGLRARYESDWTGRYHGRASLVVRPSDTAEVAAVVSACRRAGAPLVPQGGNTGLVGGGVPRDGEVVVSLERLRDLQPVDTAAGEVTVGAGVTLVRLQGQLHGSGFAFGVDLAARDSATIGGMIATNAGGVRVLRHGTMRAQVIGIEAVLADGRVLARLPGLAKDNTGYHLPSLLTGSEGSLAVITRARLRLVPAREARVVAVIATDGTQAAMTAFARLRRLPTLEAAEILYPDGLELVRDHTGAVPPFAAGRGAYLLVECAGEQDPTDALAAAVAEMPAVADVAVATDGPGRARLWHLREAHTEAINAAGVPHKLDVTVPLGSLVAFERDVRATVRDVDPTARVILFGHVGDGNLHVNVLGPAADDGRVDGAVLQLVAAYGGSISAEHGIGTAKVGWLQLTRDAVDIAAMRAIKRALDPDGLLNPGVILPAETDRGGGGFPAGGGGSARSYPPTA
jgi:FAD/FMN-containing dehydrogenase